MTSIGFLILFFLGCLLFPCEGQVQPPSKVDIFTRLIFLPGSTVKIDWSYLGDISQVDLRTWFFNSSDGSRIGRLARILADGDPGQQNFTLIPRFEIDKPAALILKNVDQSYNGMYTFNLLDGTSAQPQSSEVVVFIAKKPTVTLSCSSPITVNEGDDFTCVCRGEGGNPPANVTWYKDGVQIGGTGKEEQTLSLSNVSRTDNGTYECEARSHTDDRFADKKSIEVEVNYPPENVKLMLTRSGKSATIRCTAEARPPASFKIFLNQTKVVQTDQMLTIPEVDTSHVGYYTCFASNYLGNKTSDPAYLPLKGPTTPTPTPTTSTTASTMSKDPSAGKSDNGGLGVGAIIGIVIGVLVLLIIVIVVVWRYKLKEKDGYRGNRNVDPIEMDDNAYDTVKNEPSGSKSNPQASTLPVYAAVDKNNREGKPLYATLDTVAMNSNDSKRRSEESKPEPTQYASIDFNRSGEVPKADLV